MIPCYDPGEVGINHEAAVGRATLAAARARAVSMAHIAAAGDN